MPVLYLVDGHAQFFRAYHAIRPGMKSPVTDEPTNMTFGFVGTILKLLRQDRPDYLAVVIDASGDQGTFRSRIYPEYKAHRKPPPEDFDPQVERCVSLLGQMGIPVLAVEGVEADDTIATVVRRRVVWLLLLFVGGSLTANVLGLFEQQLHEVVALTFFIPLLIGTGGNTGAQTVSTLIRAMAMREVGPRDVWRVIRRECITGIVLGAGLGVVALGRVLVSGQWFDLALTVALSVVAICCWANVIGALVPLVARRLGIDPALVSAPLITTLVDATGLAIYLLIARMLLGI